MAIYILKKIMEQSQAVTKPVHLFLSFFFQTQNGIYFEALKIHLQFTRGCIENWDLIVKVKKSVDVVFIWYQSSPHRFLKDVT